MEATFLVVGGGIAGVSCCETIQFLCPDEKIILITESSLIKTVTNLVPLGKALTKFDVEERDAASTLKGNLQVVKDRLNAIDSEAKTITTDEGLKIKYRFLCICTGARPKLIEPGDGAAQFVLGIRDTESVLEFQKRIKNCKKIALVGNGGIASEIVYEVQNCTIDWVIKDRFISQTFVDPGAAEFFQCRIKQKTAKTESKPSIKRMRYSEENCGEGSRSGAALGPDWHRKLDLSGDAEPLPDSVNIHYNCEIKTIDRIADSEHPLTVTLTNDDSFNCDLVISATGVNPSINFQCDRPFDLAEDGGIVVDERMATSIKDVYACGDVCTAGWKQADHWFQMRLWTQARQMGSMAGKSMVAALQHEDVEQDFCFEIFGHVTQLFGHQVVLLGKYNGQGLGNNYEVLLRMTPDKEYIKYVIVEGRLQGAILIGDTGLEETTENLILNQLDISPYGDDLLNPDIDIEDYFD